MNTHIFRFTARLHGRSSSGYVEATTALQAQQIVQYHNEMFSNIRVTVAKNQDAARKQPCIK